MRQPSIGPRTANTGGYGLASAYCPPTPDLSQAIPDDEVDRCPPTRGDHLFNDRQSNLQIATWHIGTFRRPPRLQLGRKGPRQARCYKRYGHAQVPHTPPILKHRSHAQAHRFIERSWSSFTGLAFERPVTPF